MRDPRLGGNTSRRRDEAQEPPIGETRTAASTNLQDGAINSVPRPERTPASVSAYNMEQSQRNGLGRLRPRTSAGMNGAYDELYRSQLNGNVESMSRDPSPVPNRPRSTIHPNLNRARSDLGPRQDNEDTEGESGSRDGAAWKMRHGWEDEHTSSEYLSLLTSTFYMYFTDKRHDTCGIPRSSSPSWPNQDWRMKDRLKTVSAALAICLNIGVDPPDVVKTNPCAKLESWTDPTTSTGGPSSKALDQIGKRLQEQYETLSLRTRYKQYLDPSVEDTKKFCVSMRRNAKDERVLFHYNGHGVPLPTQSGELWVFNKNYTQYIPVSLYDLQSWLAGPSLFVYDVSHAGNIVHNFPTFAEKHEKEQMEIRRKDPNAPIQNYGDCIQLAACGRAESLPTNPDLPADLFTCCLTTPIDIALRFFVLQNPLKQSIKIDDNKIPVPGRLQDRRSPLGELNWIFTAITDTIAWNVLPRNLFKKLFRQDLMVAALFRNFLLSERIMRANKCSPISLPALPETHHHPLWQSWDLAVEMVLSQLPFLLEQEEGKRSYEYQHSTFFAEQLTAFEVYLSSGPKEDEAPDQLPIVLQVLLSQAHRLRALILLSKFLDLGPWAVHLALSIGIFPYVVKLLQSAAAELKPVMVFIWARIMAVDYTVQNDLLKDNGIHYFIAILNPYSDIRVPNATEHRAMCAFIVATFCKNYPQGQNVCCSGELFEYCLSNLDNENPLLRTWTCLCFSMLWLDYPEAKWMGIRTGACVRLCDLAFDPVPEVRAAMLHALTNFLGIPDLTDQVAQIEESIAAAILFMANDGAVLVRKELLVLFSFFVPRYENKFTVAAYEQLLEEKESLLALVFNDSVEKSGNGKDPGSRGSTISQSISRNSIFASMWKQILILSVDPHPEVARNASFIVDWTHEALINSPMATLAKGVLEEVIHLSQQLPIAKSKNKGPLESIPQPNPANASQSPQKPQGYNSLSLRGLKNLVFGGAASEAQGPNGSVADKKQFSPSRPPNTPRARAPPEWTRPPESDEPSKPLGPYLQAPVPLSPGFRFTDAMEAGRSSLPLKSTLLDWSTEYFREPQMRPHEPEEPGSSDYNQRLWRRSRNDRIISSNQPLKGSAGQSRWDKVDKVLPNATSGGQPTKMCFHQFESHIALVDDRDTICVWDYNSPRLLSRFSAANPGTSRVTTLRFINEDDSALLLLGSSDGVLKVFRNYDQHPATATPSLNTGAPEQDQGVEMVTSFRALTDVVQSTKSAGVVVEWMQGQGRALVAGDVRVIRVWNVATECCTIDIPARSSSPVTSLTSDAVAGDIFVAGFGDGAIRVFDQRLRPNLAMVRLWREHKQWITGVHMQRGGVRELISGSREGSVRLWDLRWDKSVRTIQGLRQPHIPPGQPGDGVKGTGEKDETMRALAVHEHAPVFCVGGSRNGVRSWNMDGKFLGSFEPGRGILGGLGAGKRAIKGIAYHPHAMLMGVAVGGVGDVTILGAEGVGR